MTSSFKSIFPVIFYLLIAASCGRGEPVDWSIDAPGDLKLFRVSETYEAIRKFAGRNAELCKLHAYKVESSGIMDLNRPVYSLKSKNHINYHFIRPNARGKIDAGPGGKSIRKHTYPFEALEISIGRIPYMSRRSKLRKKVRDVNVIKASGKRKKCETIQSPKPFSGIWQKALKEGAPKNAVASITYDKNGYKFAIYKIVEIQSQYNKKTVRELVFQMQMDKSLKLISKKNMGGDK